MSTERRNATQYRQRTKGQGQVAFYMQTSMGLIQMELLDMQR